MSKPKNHKHKNPYVNWYKKLKRNGVEKVLKNPKKYLPKNEKFYNQKYLDNLNWYLKTVINSEKFKKYINS